MNTNITLIRYPSNEDWLRCKRLCLATVWKTSSKDPTGEWKEKILDARHSPIRTLMFTIKMAIPYYVSVHFVRHKIGVDHYVSTQRNDRQQKYDRTKAPQDAIVYHIMDLNAEALITIAQKRLCKCADPVTQSVMSDIVEVVLKVCPEFKNVLVKPCVYNGKCHEFFPCNKG